MSEIQPLTDAEVEEECAYVEELAHDAIKRNEDQHRLARVSLNASRLLNLLARIRADGRRLERVVNAAVEFWKMNRPIGWSQKEHLDNPKVNAVSDEEMALCREIAKFLKPDDAKDKTK